MEDNNKATTPYKEKINDDSLNLKRIDEIMIKRPNSSSKSKQKRNIINSENL